MRFAKKMRALFLLNLLAIMLFATGNAQAEVNAWTSNGIDSGDAKALAASSANTSDWDRFESVYQVEKSVTMPFAAAATTLGDIPAEGNLSIKIYDSGNIAIYRYIAGRWQPQMYGGAAKGSRLQINGVGYSIGYYSGTPAALVSNTRISDTRITSVWTAGGARITLDTTYQPGAPYFGMQWTITNESGGSLNDLRFFHGEDTYFYNSDFGGGFWDSPNHTVGVQRTISGQLMRMSLQAITAPYAYDSMYYYSVYNNVGAGALTNTIDPLQTTDNGYALEWRKASMQNGEAWTITAYEKFADVAIGAVSVTAPTQTDCSIGSVCNLTFTVTNISQASATVSLSVASSLTGWDAQILTPASPVVVPVGSSQQVNVQVSIPANAMNGLIGNVTLSASDGIYTASDVAAVRAVSRTYTVTPSAGPGGTISPSTPQTVNANATATFTVTPDSGYTASVSGTCSGSLVGSTYTTLPIIADCTVVASFTAGTYTVTPSAGPGGTISPSTPQTVNANATATFTVTPDSGYSIASVTGCGGTLSGNRYTTGAITMDCTVTAVFRAIANPVSGVCGSSNGGTFTVAPTANLCSKGTATAVSGSGPWTWSCRGSNGGATASCSANLQSYTVSTSAGAGGAISPSGATVNFGHTASFTVTPEAGYSIASVSGCGGTLSGNIYTTGPITANCSVTASFNANPINGVCGASNGGSFDTVPTANFCTAGIASAVSGSGPWTWTCNGANGGTSASCSANLQSYTVSTSAGAGGAISPSGATVNFGHTASFTVTPEAGYSIASVSGCGGTLSGNIYTTGPITANCSVSASFKTTVTITTPLGPIEVPVGGPFTIKVGSPSSNVIVDGISMGPVLTITFINVTGPHTITW